MKLRWLAVAAAALLLAGHASAEDGPKLTNLKDKVSYSIGMDIGNNLKKQSVDVDVDILAKGVKDALAGGETLLTGEEVRETLVALQQELRAKALERRKQDAENNKKEGEAFLAGNKTKEGVVSLPSGLQYKILRSGDGPSPKGTDTVETNYRGTLINGTEFDSSYKRGQTAVFPVTGVIAGWTEALQLMKVGDKWQLFVPPELAYGERGAGPIGPNSTLIFEVELLSIKSDVEGESSGKEKPAENP
jgi:FKBP-type peptidyl-prolyl cis-trans isomerase FklB